MNPPLTNTRRIKRGNSDPLGWRDLEFVDGESHIGNVSEGKVIGCLWHLTDLHLCDAESPARIEYLDRYADPDSPMKEEFEEIGTYRPNEFLTVQVAASMVDTVNQISVGPVTGARVDAVLITGDVTDNAQVNELDWYQTLIRGGTITPGSGGSDSSWVGVSNSDFWDERYWHPDGPPPGHDADRPTRIFGFPIIPGLIEAAREPVHSPGLSYPVLSVHGNHDALLQGTVVPSENMREFAIGDQAITRLSEPVDPAAITRAVAAHGPAEYISKLNAPFRRINPDSQRSFVTPGSFARAADRENNYWAEDVNQLRLICLDTVNPFGGWQGSLDVKQFDWLKSELDSNPDRFIVISSHHPSPTMTNDYSTDDSVRILGPSVVDLLLDYPNVILWIAGHVHFNAAIEHRRQDNNFWEITTSSLIDWPQQGRILEFIDTGEHVEIISTVTDHDSPLMYDPQLPLDIRHMAGVSRLLAANDYQRRSLTPLNELREGQPEARNVVWTSSY